MISVLMSVFNEKIEWIKEAVSSVLCQTYSNFEFIIIIDNPLLEPDIVEYLEQQKKQDGRIILVYNEINMGLALSMNKGLQIASGEYIARMDADDVSEPFRFEKELNYIVANNLDMVASKFVTIDENGNLIKYSKRKNCELKYLLPYGNEICHPSVLVKTEKLKEIGGYRDFKTAQDYDLWLRMLSAQFNMDVMDEYLVKYRVRSNSVSIEKSAIQFFTSRYQIKLYKERKRKGRDSFTENNFNSYLNKKIKKEIHFKKAKIHYCYFSEYVKQRNLKLFVEFFKAFWNCPIYTVSNIISRYAVHLAKIKKLLHDKKYQYNLAYSLGLTNLIPDRRHIKNIFYYELGKRLDLNNPKTFNQKLQWLKLYDRNPKYSQLVDKYAIKEVISQKFGKEYVIPTLGVWCSFGEINFDTLPDQFVLKCTHDSGGLVICKDKQTFDMSKAKEKINKSLKRNFYYYGREWPYKNVKPRIIAEQYMEDAETKELRDYKFFCFNGKVKCFKIDFDRATQHRANYYDENGKLLPFGEAAYPPDHSRNIKLPEELNKMIELAENLAADIPFVRVDFYDANGHIYFGEMTFYPASGFGKFIPEEWDYKLGEWLTLPEKKK